MSEPKQISPLLSNHAIGSAISTHHGVSCYPAMDMASQQKYIVKVISIPASQKQLAAFLLSGAYPDKDAALAYFKELADDTAAEADLLQRLARLEGFVGYEGCQIVPMEEGTGYEVYLKGAYRPTLERYLSRKPMTHLAAVNLGLDLCAALSACRRSGYLYVDVKPGNIYICDDREYRLGDLGFIRLSSLQYASMPDKYISSYTAPEITDAYSALNTTLDTYAVGLILYQVFNNAELPFTGRAPAEPLPPPPYADYEMAEIILKACDPNPENRWEDPAQMGQALVSYLQRNTVNDTPILPPVLSAPAEPEIPAAAEAQEEVPVEETAEDVPETEEPPVEETEEETAEETPVEETEDAPEAEEPPVEEAESVKAEEDFPQPEEIPAEPSEEAETPAEAAVPEDAPAETVETEAAPTEAVETEEAPVEATETEETPVEAPKTEETAEEVPAEISEAEKELAILNELLQDETAPTEESAAGLDDSCVSDETSKMLAQVDELISHELPEPVVAPEPIDVPIPPRIQPEPEAAEETPEETAEETPEVPADAEKTEESPETESDESSDEEEAAGFDVIATPEPAAPGPFRTFEEEDDDTPISQPRKSHAGLIAGLTVILLLILLALGGYLYYTNYYLQSVDGLTLQASDNELTVLLDTDIDSNLLTVACTDTYGNVKYSAVQNNTAHFTDLRPDTNYRITVRIEGFHQLIGTTTGSHSTAAQTTISSFTGVTGSEDGSVILNFTVQGPETSAWRVVYTAAGEAEKSMDFTGHMVTVTGLTVGKEYTFRLESTDGLYLVGTDTLTYTATKIIYAQNLTALGFHSGSLTATWDAPADAAVENWAVRCYNDAGYDNTLIVTGTKAIFPNLDTAAAYTIEVTAEGMSVGTRTYVSANSITFTGIEAVATDRKQLTVSWSYEGTAPKDGWLVLYTADGCEPNVIQCAGNATSAVISPLIPGAHYEITIQPTGGGTVFGGTYAFDASDAPLFSGYMVSCEDMVFSMCLRPEKDGWTQADVPSGNYTTNFRTGDKASFVIKLNHEYNTSRDRIDILFVIRNAKNVPVSFNTVTRTWLNMWYKGYGTLDIPVLPETPGNYTVEIYYNGASVTTQSFTVS